MQAQVHTFFDYCEQSKRVDAPTFGYGSGVLLRPEVVAQAIDANEAAHGKALKIFFSPQGKQLTQDLARELVQRILTSESQHLMLVASRYEGMDARVEELYADEQISIGNYVLMGGDLPSMVFLEAILRHVPGVVGKQDSVAHDSFTGAFVDHPSYTAPVEWRGMRVPEILRSGNHGAIDAWRLEQAARATVLKHFTWLRSCAMTEHERGLAANYIPRHYVALMHDEVRLKTQDSQELVGTSSVTTIDIHDIARSSCTYGLKNVFIVTPLADQQAIVKTMLEFWLGGKGEAYNPSRYKAVQRVRLIESLNAVCAAIREQEGVDPLIVVTSARQADAASGPERITYFDQERVWQHGRPVLIVLGTAQGLASSVLQRADYVLEPIRGFSDFNHLSVRSAAAIIFDRWLGINLARR